MLAGRNKTFKGQDILLLMKIISRGKDAWRIIDLAQELDLSPSEISLGLERLRFSGFLYPDKRKIYKSAVIEFLIHGLKYVFPPELGPERRGISTAHSFILSKKIVSDQKLIWPTEEGETRGTSILPIYASVPHAVMKDKKLHRLLALIDLIRVGRAREQQFASEELQKEIEVS